jgi:hypothetical protein
MVAGKGFHVGMQRLMRHTDEATGPHSKHSQQYLLPQFFTLRPWEMCDVMESAHELHSVWLVLSNLQPKRWSQDTVNLRRGCSHSLALQNASMMMPAYG